MTLAERLHETMVDAGLSQLRLAKEAGCNDGYVRDIIRGKVKKPSAEALHRLAKVLRVTPEWLLFGEMEAASAPDKAPSGAGPRLRETRKAAGLSAVELGALVGLSESAVRNQENGTNGIPADAAEAYAKALGVDPGWLLFGSPSVAPMSPGGNSEALFQPAGRPSGSEGNGAAPAEKITLTLTVSPCMAKRILTMLDGE